MSKNILNAPEGMKSYLPKEALKFYEIRDRISRVFQNWGYEPVITPVLEYYESLLTGMEQNTQKEFYKLIDYDGNILSLRPEMTAPIARTVVNRREELSLPLRLSYFAPVFRYDNPQEGKNREIFQMGLEFIGGNSFGDAEAIITAIEAIKSTGIEKFKLDLNHIGFLEGIVEELPLKGLQEKKLKEYLGRKDFVGLRNYLDNIGLKQKEIIAQLPLLRGGIDILNKADDLASTEASRKAVEKLKDIYEYLESYKVEDYVNFDFSLIRGLNYYTGMIFEGFTENLGYTICGGGRYDNLIEQYGGKKTPAVGFALGIQRIALALDYKGTSSIDGVLHLTEKTRSQALKLARRLHRKDYNIIIEENNRSRDELIKLAHQKNAAKIISIIETKSQKEAAEIEVLDTNSETAEKVVLKEGWEKKVWGK